MQLTAYAARDWRANFFPVGIAHSIVGGSAWEPTPWRAVQRAAWNTLWRRSVSDDGEPRRARWRPTSGVIEAYLGNPDDAAI